MSAPGRPWRRHWPRSMEGSKAQPGPVQHRRRGTARALERATEGILMRPTLEAEGSSVSIGHETDQVRQLGGWRGGEQRETLARMGAASVSQDGPHRCASL